MRKALKEFVDEFWGWLHDNPVHGVSMVAAFLFIFWVLVIVGEEAVLNEIHDHGRFDAAIALLLFYAILRAGGKQ